MHSVIVVHSFVLAVLLTWFLRYRATSLAKRALGHRAAHHLHVVPTPRIGGAAIWIGVVLSLALPIAIGGVQLGDSRSALFNLLLSTAIIFGLGIVDDFYSLGYRTKLLGQFVAATLFVVLQFKEVVREAASFSLPSVLTISLMIFWIVLTTNAFNLLDGLDGLAAGTALTATIVLLIISHVYGNLAVSLAAASIAGALTGFLRFNVHPASIFMGDSGSMFIGFALGAMAMLDAQSSPSPIAAMLAALVCFALPIADTTLAVFRRFVSGRSIFSADCEHIHHRALASGLDHRQVAFRLCLISVGCGALGSLIWLFGPPAAVPSLFIFAIGLLFGVDWLDYDEVAEMRRLLDKIMRHRREVANNVHIRRAVRSLASVRGTPALFEVLDNTFTKQLFSGYDLQLNDKTLRRVGDSFARAQRNGSANGPQLVPHRFSNRSESTARQWQFSVGLVSSTGEQVGILTVHRPFTPEPLLMDFNLLVMTFSTALADSIAMMHPIEGQEVQHGNGNATAVDNAAALALTHLNARAS